MNFLTKAIAGAWLFGYFGQGMLAAGVSPSLRVWLDGEKTQIAFTGLLLSAPAPEGPWEVVTNALSPHTPAPSPGQRFYRSLVPPQPALFGSREVFPLRVTGPMQAHFDLAYAGVPDGIIPPFRDKPYFTGTVEIPGLSLPVDLRVRGNSSLQECPFPKLKFKVSRASRAGTPFESAREVKIGTHCAEGGRGTIGRLRHEIAAYREALAYEILDTLGLIAPKVRRASIEYRDTTPPTNAQVSVGWVLTRESLLLEDIEVVAERYVAAKVLDDEALGQVQTSQINPQTITDLQLFHALIGNWDYTLGWDYKGVWNTDVIELNDGTLLPVAGDFDLASWVTTEVVSSAPHWYHPELTELERETLFQVERIRDQAPAGTYGAARARFQEKRTALESQVASAQLDDEGRANAGRHLTAWYTALAATFPTAWQR